MERPKKHIEPNTTIRKIETIALILLLIGSALAYIRGAGSLNGDPGELSYVGETVMERDFDAEDYDEDSTSCDVIFVNEEGQLIKTYTYEDYEKLEDEDIPF